MIQPGSETWLAVARTARDGIEGAATALQRRDLDIRPTEYERGRIAAFKEILALAEPPREPIPSGDPHY